MSFVVAAKNKSNKNVKELYGDNQKIFIKH